MSQRIKRLGSFVLCFVAALSCEEQPAPGTDIENAAQRLPADPVTLSLAFPPQELADAVLTARTAVSVGNRSSLVAGSGHASVVNLGSGALELGVRSELGSVLSVGPVRVGPSATVHGDATSAGAISLQPGAQVLGTTAPNSTLDIDPEVTFAVHYPAETEGVFELPPDQVQTLAPARYTKVAVQPRSRLTLRMGSYYLDSLEVAPGASLIIDNDNGPVFVYVRNGLVLEGEVRRTDGWDPELVLAYFGTGAVQVNGRFGGTLLARAAELKLKGAGPHEGTFYADRIAVDPDSSIRYRPFRPTAFRFADGTPIGECSNRSAAEGSPRTVCLAEPRSDRASIEFYVDGAAASGSGDCVEVTVRAPSTEVRTFELDAAGRTLRSDVVFLSTPELAGRCPLYRRVILGTREDDVLRGTPDAEYISGGPGNDLIIGEGDADVLVGGAGSDVYDFVGLKPVQIALASLINGAGDHVYLGFKPGNPAGLFASTRAPVGAGDVTHVEQRFQQAAFGPTPADFAAAFSLSQASPLAQSAQGLAAAPFEVRFDDVRGSVVAGDAERLTVGFSTADRFVLALRQEVFPSADSALQCGGTLARCVFSSMVMVAPDGTPSSPIVLPRAQHFINGVTYLRNGRFVVSGHTGELADDSPCEPVGSNDECQAESAFIARFDANAAKFDFIQYFDGRIKNPFGSGYSPGAPGAVFHSARSGPRETLTAVGWTEADGFVEADSDFFVERAGLKGYAIVFSSFTPLADHPNPQELGIRDARAFLGLDTGEFSRLKHMTPPFRREGGDDLLFLAGGQAITGHSDPWLVSLRVTPDDEIRLNAERVLSNSSELSEVAGLERNYAIGWTDEFNQNDRLGVAGFVTRVNRLTLQPDWSTPAQASRFFAHAPGLFLFGGSAQNLARGLSISRVSNHVFVAGEIHFPWSDALLDELPDPATAGHYGYVVKTDANGVVLRQQTIDNTSPGSAIETYPIGVLEGFSRGVLVFGKVCIPFEGLEECHPEPYLVAVDGELGLPSCNCSDGVANCGEQGPDCGGVCSTACPDPPPQPPDDPPPMPEPTCKIDPDGTESTVYVDTALAEDFVTSHGCAGCHGANLAGTPSAPCLRQYSGAPASVGECLRDTVMNGRPGTSMPAQRTAIEQFAEERDAACVPEIIANYLLGLSGSCSPTARPSLCNPP